MSNIVLSSKTQLDTGTTLYGDADVANPLTNLTNSIFSRVWRYTPGTNADGNTAKFAMSLNPVARASHLVLSRHNMGESAQIRVRAGTARFDADFTSDAPTFATPSEITFGGGANGTRTNEYGVMVAGTCPRYEHDRRYYENGFVYVEDVSNANWTTSSARAYSDGKTVAFEAVGAQLYQALPQLYNATYEVKAQVRLVSGDGSFAFNVYNGTTNTQGSTKTATSDWQWFTSDIATGAETMSGRAGLWKLSGAGVLQVRRMQISRGASNGKYRKTTSARRYQRLGVITEAAATNSLIRSSELDDAAWTKTNATITANSGVAPDGTTSMDTVTASAASGNVVQDLALGGTTARALSCVFKSGGTSTSTDLVIRWMTGGVSQQVTCRFNASSGAFVSSTSTGATLRQADVNDIGGGFFLAYVLGVGTDAANTVVRSQLIVNTSGQACQVWGFQNEASYVTTYIPTTTAAVTRTVDTAVGESVTWVPYAWNAAEGTVYHETMSNDIPADTTRGFGYVRAYTDASNQILSRILWNGAASVAVDVQVTVGGVSAFDSADTNVSNNVANRQAYRYRASDWATAVNGSIVSTSPSAGVPPVSNIDLMFSPGPTGYLRRVTIWPTGKSNTDLQALTTSGPSAIDFDSGWDDVLQMTMRGDVSSTWGHDYPIIKTFASRAVEWVRVELYDPAKVSASFPFEIGRAFMGKVTLQPARNAEYGLGNGWIERTTFTQAHDGRKFFNELPRIREVAFAFPLLTDDERDTWHEIQGAGGIAEEVLYLPDPDDEAECQRYGFVGLLESLEPLKHHMLAHHSMSGQICQKR